ncbi:MAG: TVP38/TMEM64 family protein [Patescibacteria group bacterium]
MENNNKTIIQKKLLYYLVAILVVFLALWVFIYTYQPVRDFINSPTALREWVQSLGYFAPLVIIIYHAIQVVIAPLPGLMIDITNGYVFGPYFGIVVSYVGIFLGTLSAIALGRRFGRPLVIRLAATPRFERLDNIAASRGLWFFFILFMIPGMPHDAMSLALGLTKAPIWKLMTLTMIGRAPTIIAAVLIGSSGANHFSPLQLTGITLILIIALSPVLWLTTRIKKPI